MRAKDWTRSTDIRKLLPFVLDRMSERKRRLFVVACCRAVEPLLEARSRRLIDLAEEYADGRGNREELNEAAQQVDARAAGLFLGPVEAHIAALAAAAVVGAAHVTRDIQQAAILVAQLQPELPALLLRDLIGNPYHTVTLDSNWLTWNAGAVEKLARAIYDERRFDELPLLADALAEAGCGDAEILEHLRGPGPHARGCWVVDLLLRLR